jgi:hypothetical protein
VEATKASEITGDGELDIDAVVAGGPQVLSHLPGVKDDEVVRKVL